MNLPSAKLELIEWISTSDDEQLLEQIFHLYLNRKKKQSQIILRKILTSRAFASESDIGNNKVFTEVEMKTEIAKW